MAGPHDLHDHVVLVGQHDPLAAHLGLVVFGDRQQFEVFGDLLLFLDAVDAAGGRIDEALDAVTLGAIGELHRRKAADFPGQLRIEIAAGIVGDARQMDDRIDAGQIDFIGVAYVALDDGEIRMRLEEIAEPHDVECDDLVAGLEQLGNENAALVAARASHKNLHLLTAPRNSPRALVRRDVAFALPNSDRRQLQTKTGDHDRPTTTRTVARLLLKLRMGPAQAFWIADVPVITICLHA